MMNLCLVGARPADTRASPSVPPPPHPRSHPIMVLWILRGSFTALLLGLGLVVLDNFTKAGQFGAGLTALVGILAFGAIVVAVDVRVRDKQITTISAVYFGLLLGLLL